MIDENYHIADLDDVDHYEESIDGVETKEKPIIKTKVIYENSDTSKDEYTDKKSDFFEDKERIKWNNNYSDNIEDNGEEYRQYNSSESTVKKEKTRKRRFLIEEWFFDAYDKSPNTFKATIIGIVLAFLILLIGFAKTLLIFVVVLVANIVGQFLDNSPRILSIIDAISRRMK